MNENGQPDTAEFAKFERALEQPTPAAEDAPAEK